MTWMPSVTSGLEARQVKPQVYCKIEYVGTHVLMTQYDVQECYRNVEMQLHHFSVISYVCDSL